MTEVLDYQTFQEHAFAVVDARMVEQLPSGLVTEALVPQRLAGSAHLMPTLIDLQRTSRARSDALFKCMSEFPTDAGPLPPVALLLRTSASAAAIARHWNSMQLVEPRPGARLWLRLHDPRVLHQMLRVLSPAQEAFRAVAGIYLLGRWDVGVGHAGDGWLAHSDCRERSIAAYCSVGYGVELEAHRAYRPGQ